MKLLNLGFGAKHITFQIGRNALYSSGKTNKVKEVVYLGQKDGDSYYTNTQVIIKPFFITQDFVLRDDGKLELK